MAENAKWKQKLKEVAPKAPVDMLTLDRVAVHKKEARIVVSLLSTGVLTRAQYAAVKMGLMAMFGKKSGVQVDLAVSCPKLADDFMADPEKNAGFYSFAELCIRRQLISALKGASRLKHSPLNTYVSLNKPVQEDSERTLMDVLGGSRLDDPETLLISREEYTVITGKIERVLSDFEKQVLEAYLSGYSYRDIAKQTGAQPKSVDNALQRIKKKLERALGRSR